MAVRERMEREASPSAAMLDSQSVKSPGEGPAETANITATAEDLRLFQLHQTRIGMQPPSINGAVSALRFFFTVTLDRPDLSRRLTVVPQPLSLIHI